MNTSKKQLDEMQKRFLIKYWKMTIVMAVSFVAAGIVGLFVFLSFTTNAIATGFVQVEDSSIGTLNFQKKTRKDGKAEVDVKRAMLSDS